MLRKLLQLSASLLTLIAFTNAAAASSLIGFQPELPEELQNIE